MLKIFFSRDLLSLSVRCYLIISTGQVNFAFWSQRIFVSSPYVCLYIFLYTERRLQADLLNYTTQHQTNILPKGKRRDNVEGSSTITTFSMINNTAESYSCVHYFLLNMNKAYDLSPFLTTSPKQECT
jgi:hypothetical protein